jgi:hypothetical protein
MSYGAAQSTQVPTACTLHFRCARFDIEAPDANNSQALDAASFPEGKSNRRTQYSYESCQPQRPLCFGLMTS